MKKTTTLLLLCLAFALVLAGCGDKVSPDWSVDLTNHWHRTESGKQADLAAHELDELGACTVCGAQIMSQDDGSTAVSLYNDRGNSTAWLEYGDDGSLVYQLITEYQYDSDGDVTSSKTLEDGRLLEQTNYRPAESGADSPVLADATYYNEDGSREYSEYDELGDLRRVTCYDAEGNVTDVQEYEFKYDAEGNYIGEKISTGGMLTYESFYEFSDDGIFYMTKEVFYDAEGEVESEYVYDTEGNQIN